MSVRTLCFAYGSNMAVERLHSRVGTVELVCVATLAAHALRFHKPGSRDGSGKCDAAPTGNPDDRVYGAVYSIRSEQMPALDRIEGAGSGYERRTMTVVAMSGASYRVETYLATLIDPRLRPFDWYKEHVLRGARALGLPAGYVAAIEAVEVVVDTDDARRTRELAIYR